MKNPSIITFHIVHTLQSTPLLSHQNPNFSFICLEVVAASSVPVVPGISVRSSHFLPWTSLHIALRSRFRAGRGIWWWNHRYMIRSSGWRDRRTSVNCLLAHPMGSYIRDSFGEVTWRIVKESCIAQGSMADKPTLSKTRFLARKQRPLDRNAKGSSTRSRWNCRIWSASS